VKPLLSADQQSELIEVFRLIGEPNRLRIVLRCLDGPQGKQVFYSLPDCHVREMLVNMIEHLGETHEHRDRKLLEGEII
jgi:ArsR family transcriptional regulator, lead/cadmium/zinc/bismuth-responsive transcriptional repressor